EVRLGVAHAVTGKPAASPVEHARREVEAREDGVGISVSHEKSRIPAVAAARVENALAAADVERAGANQPASEGFVARYQPRTRRKRAGQAVVVILNEATIIEKGTPPGFLRFQGAAKAGASRRIDVGHDESFQQE